MDDALIRFRGELYRSAERSIRRRRRRARTLVALAAAGAFALSGGAIAANRILGSLGTPAPPSVTRDFDSFHTQLGFHPQGSAAVLSATDEGTGVDLYVTPNSEGTSCVTITAPWKTSPDQDDGGSCIALADADTPILAGFLGANTSKAGASTFVLGGGVTTPGAVAVRFATVAGGEVVRSLGLGGFFVVGLSAGDTGIVSGGCGDDWAPAFAALDADGHELEHTVIRLTHGITDACAFPGGIGPGLTLTPR